MSIQYDVEKSYAASLSIMKKRAVSFYGAFRMLPQDRFRAVAAIYAFCRSADDIADAVSEGKRMDPKHAILALERMEVLMKELFQNGHDPIHNELEEWPWSPALSHSIVEFELSLDPFLQQIEGQRRDVVFQGIETVKELIHYSKLVAGSVGKMLLPLLSLDAETAKSPELEKACEDLGVAMQITNILRDVGEDLMLRDRIYLPQELMQKYNLQKRDLQVLIQQGDATSFHIPQNFIDLWEELATLADSFYQRINSWLCLIHPSSRKPLLAAARSYQSIADAVRAEEYNCLTTRCYTPEAKRMTIYQEVEQCIDSLTC